MKGHVDWESSAISSAVERLPYKQDVAGSNPASRIEFCRATDYSALRHSVDLVVTSLSLKGFQELVDYWCASPQFML